MKKEFYFIRVDEYNNWTPAKYRKVTCEELDSILDLYGDKVLRLCSNGKQGSMTMWAYFKNRISSGCYSDMINAYQLLSDDNRSLVEREHEFRHAYEEYLELWRIRYFGSVEEYYLKKAEEAAENIKKYTDKQ